MSDSNLLELLEMYIDMVEKQDEATPTIKIDKETSLRNRTYA